VNACKNNPTHFFGHIKSTLSIVRVSIYKCWYSKSWSTEQKKRKKCTEIWLKDNGITRENN